MNVQDLTVISLPNTKAVFCARAVRRESMAICHDARQQGGWGREKKRGMEERKEGMKEGHYSFQHFFIRDLGGP